MADRIKKGVLSNRHPAQPEPSKKAGAVLADAAAVHRQQKILSSAGVPDTMRLEAAAKQMTPAAADGAARKVLLRVRELGVSQQAGRLSQRLKKEAAAAGRLIR